ncbi:unnamed protein product [Peronospora destructor]|uniref:PDZ domain-containing protein n=1 Tax=Peronospora destructor TaxID=86335 RepID=A0AAV0V5W7_9STRA|nr:unnamed protein product [Peronospora destructor]
MAANQFDVVWRQDTLGLRFTPNENDLPVVCQVPSNTCSAVLASPLVVGDVLVAYDLQLANQSTSMQLVQCFDQLVTVLRCATLPVTLRFQSREKEIPQKVDESDIACSYVFTWEAHTSIGVSLAMDPCSLHTAITTIDSNKISSAFQDLKPMLGDVLVATSRDIDDSEVTRLDEMRFEDVIVTLRHLGLVQIEEDNVLFSGRPKATSSSSDKADKAMDILRPPFLKRPVQVLRKTRLRDDLPPPRKQIPISMRKSFRIDKLVPNPPSSGESRPRAVSTISEDGRPRVASSVDDKGFYTVMFSGGAVGMQLRDCSQDDKDLMKSNDKTNRTNGYAAAIRNVTDPKSAPGLEIAMVDDLLMAIGQKDLQHMSFEDVRKDLGAIQSPTQLLFKKRKRVVGNSSGSSLIESLLLFLM